MRILSATIKITTTEANQNIFDLEEVKNKIMELKNMTSDDYDILFNEGLYGVKGMLMALTIICSGDNKILINNDTVANDTLSRVYDLQTTAYVYSAKIVSPTSATVLISLQ